MRFNGSQAPSRVLDALNGDEEALITGRYENMDNEGE
jgi:hypothetical protein